MTTFVISYTDGSPKDVVSAKSVSVGEAFTFLFSDEDKISLIVNNAVLATVIASEGNAP